VSKDETFLFFKESIYKRNSKNYETGGRLKSIFLRATEGIQGTLKNHHCGNKPDNVTDSISLRKLLQNTSKCTLIKAGYNVALRD
jgi:hypothetical protein